jgi:sugar porter (SP) family MFS transporter
MSAQSKSSAYAVFILSIAAIGGVLYGYDIGVINAALLYIHQDIAMSAEQTSLVVGAVLFGGSIATLIAGPLADLLGRRRLMIISVIIFVLGVTILALAHSYWQVLLGRLIQGIGVGIIIILVPLYLTETVPVAIRGRGVAAFQLLLTGGILLANLVGYHFSGLHQGDWRAMFWTAAIPGVLLFFGLFAVPESPRWLAARGNKTKAIDTINKVYGTAEAKQLISQLFDNKTSVNLTGAKTLANLFNKRYLYPLCLVFIIACVQQLTGINSILQYSATILKGGGSSSNLVAVMGSIWITLVNFLVTIIGLLLVDKMGRKPLLVVGTAGISVALLFVSLVFLLMPVTTLKAYLLIAGLVGFIFFFALGPGVVIWLALSELLPTAVRSTGMSIALSLNSLVSALLATVFLPIVSYIGYGGIFILLAFFSAIYCYIALVKLPETKGKSLEQIESYFSSKADLPVTSYATRG